MSKMTDLFNSFKGCLDILRSDGASLTGEDAFGELVRFIIMVLIEPHIDTNVIDMHFTDRSFYPLGAEDFTDEEWYNYITYTKFSNFLEYVKKQKTDIDINNIKSVYDRFIWHHVYSQHQTFKIMFEHGRKTLINDPITIKNLMLKVSELDLVNCDTDILGEVYEKIFTDSIFGANKGTKSSFGQFFTPKIVKNFMITLLNPSIKDNGEIESISDFACGTGGILNSVIKHYKTLGLFTQEELMNQLRNNIVGSEIVPKVFNLCMSNMLVSTGDILPNVICGDGLCSFIGVKTDLCCMNPPFSVPINYEKLEKSLGDNLDDCVPIKSGGKSSEMFFLQKMIYNLKIGGRCTTVMLDGSKMNSSSSNFDTVRKYLMKSCDLVKVIYCPSGTFTSTGAKTLILYFIKRKERSEVLTIDRRKKKTVYTFTSQHSTQSVKFYNFNPDTCEETFISEVGIDSIASKDYSLNYKDYVEKVEKIYKNIEVKTLGEVCDFLPKSKRQASYGKKEGLYKFYSSSSKKIQKCDVADYNTPSIVIGTGGNANIKFDTIFSCSTDNFILKTQENSNVYIRYLYYFFKTSMFILEEGFKGNGIEHISKTFIQNIRIPIPPLEKQQEIVEFLEKVFNDKKSKLSDMSSYYNFDIFQFLLNGQYELFEKMVEWFEQSIELENQKIFIKKRMERYVYINGEKYNNTIRTLGEVCDFQTGVRIVKKRSERGEYPVYGGGESVSFHTDKYSREGRTCKISREGMSLSNCVLMLNETYYLNSQGMTIISKNKDIIINEYLWNYLNNNKEKIFLCGEGAGQLAINMTKFQNIRIPIPSLEKQQEIVEYCDRQQELIKSLEKDIEDNKNIALEFMNGMMNENVEQSETIEETKEENNDEEVREGDLEEKYEEIEDVVISDTNSVISQEDTNIYTEVELKKKTGKELKKIAKNKGKTGCSQLKKSDLINKILKEQ